MLSNEAKAVAGAIAETRRQWADFRAALIARYGADLGHRMALALTQDVPKVDVVFAIDTTGSMGPYIAATVAAANDVVDALSGRGTPARLTDYRVGLVDYKDVDSSLPFPCPPDYDAVTDLPFSSKRSDIVAAIGSLPGKVSGGCDIPEDVLSGIQRAVGFPWRDGVNKAIIVMGDAPGHDPEAHSGLTSASVIAAALAVDPAVIYPIRLGFGAADAFMEALAAGTGGKSFDGSSGHVGQALLDAIATIVETPPSDTTPPSVTIDLPAPPAGQGGFFHAGQTPVSGTVTATDPANVTEIACSDGASGLELGPLEGGGTGTATRSLAVSGDGIHDVTCSATDGAGNTGAAPGSLDTATVKIDTTAPALACSVAPETLWPPNHEPVPVTASVTVTDGLSGPAGFVLATMESSEPADGAVQSFEPGTPDLDGLLRAERDGSGPGRTYTLGYTAADAAGNTAACTVTVSVPHDQRK